MTSESILLYYVCFLDVTESDPCNPSPCGSNAECHNGECTCLPEYSGDPYFGCRPECLVNSDCPINKACIKSKCVDPCVNTCGKQANCNVYNHIPMCTCLPGYSGNAFIECRKIIITEELKPCIPSPCGPNSQCREINGQAVCTCLIGYHGAPPTCRPECVTSSECALNKACSGQRCIDPCSGNCGIGASCEVVHHNPICSCPTDTTGDPFNRCIQKGNKDYSLCSIKKKFYAILHFCIKIVNAKKLCFKFFRIFLTIKLSSFV